MAWLLNLPTKQAEEPKSKPKPKGKKTPSYAAVSRPDYQKKQGPDQHRGRNGGPKGQYKEAGPKKQFQLEIIPGGIRTIVDITTQPSYPQPPKQGKAAADIQLERRPTSQQIQAQGQIPSHTENLDL